ncbi:MAG TPA: hypothetical protein VMX54_09215 [Vicinamibacteria bacterium]|nr:hypothetical protein [Vicinamibacteria bacterium]
MFTAAEPAALPPVRRAWPRRALVGLWVVVFVLAGVGLASRWDSLVRHLSRPPVGASAADGTLR